MAGKDGPPSRSSQPRFGPPSLGAASGRYSEASGPGPFAKRYVGSLKAFYPERCFGFITSSELSADVYVHARCFRDTEPERYVDAEVEFTLDGRSSPSKPRALHARVVGPGQPKPPGGPKAGRERERVKGRLRAFWSDKGFGFIALHDGSMDVFVHANSFEGQLPDDCTSGPDSPPTGQEVEFCLDVRRPERPRATSARVVGEALPPSPRAKPLGGDAAWDRWARPNGAAAAREPPKGRLERALIEVLQHKRGLEYVRKDGFALLPEVLASDQVRAALELIVPGCSAKLLDRAEPVIPSVVLKVMRDVVKTVVSASDAPCFELWEGDADGGWIRLLDARPKHVSAAAAPCREAGINRDRGHGSGLERPRDGPRPHEPLGAAAQQLRAPEKPRESGPAAAEAKDADDDCEWWRGEVGPPAQVRSVPPGNDMLDDWGPLLGGRQHEQPGKAGAAKGKSAKAPEASDPWANFADPWSRGMQGQADASGPETAGGTDAPECNELGAAPCGSSPSPAFDGGAHREDRPAGDGAAAGRREEAAPPAEVPPWLQDSTIPAQQAVHEVLRTLPGDAPLGVREYLTTWARLMGR